MVSLSAARTLAQIVGLLADFAGSQDAKKLLTYGELTEWLSSHGHAEVITAIERNHATTIAVKASLAEGRDALLAKIALLDQKISALAAGLGPIDNIARSMHPGAGLSEQARELLCEIERGQVAQMLEHHNEEGGWELFGIDAGVRGWQWAAQDSRFFQDDIQRLLILGLLAPGHPPRNASNARLFRSTRLGSEIAKQLMR